MLSSAHRAIDAVLSGNISDGASPFATDKYDMQLCMSLLPLFDFHNSAKVTRNDWLQGTHALGLDEMGNDNTWDRLRNNYGDGTQVDLKQVSYLVPLEPHVAQLLRAIVAAIDKVRTFSEGQQRKNSNQANRWLLQKRRETLQPPLVAWRDHVRKEKARWRRAERFVAKMMNHQVDRALRQWQDFAAKQQHAQQLARRMLQRGMVQALESWKDFVQKGSHRKGMARRAMQQSLVWAWMQLLRDREQGQKVRVAAARLMQRGQLMALNKWCELADQGQRMRHFAKWMLHRGVGRAWVSWLEQIKEQQRLRQFGSRMLNKGLAQALDKWDEYLNELHRLRRFGRRMMRRGLSKGWNAWAERHAEADQLLSALKKAASRMLNVCLTRSLNAWCDMADERHRLLQVLRRAANGALLRAINCWLELTERWQMLRRFGARMLRRSLGKGWNQWTAVVEEHRRLQAFARRMLNSSMVHALMTWRSLIDKRGSFQKMRRFTARIELRDLFAGFVQWVDAYEHTRKLRRFVRRLLRRGLVQAFNTWLESSGAVYHLKTFARRMLNRGLTKALNSWLDVAEQRKRLQVFARRLLRRGTLAALNKWMDVAFEHRRLLQVARRVGSRLAKRLLVRLFEAWSTLLETVNAREDLARQSLYRMVHQALAIAFHQWMLLAQQQMALRQRYAARWQNTAVAKVFQAWSRWSQGLQLSRRAVLARVTRRLELTVLTEWSNYVLEAKGQLVVAASRWLHAGLSRCFGELLGNAQEKRRMRHLATVLVGRMRNVLCTRVFIAWEGYTRAEVRHRDNITRKALAFLFGRVELLRGVILHEWRDVVVAERKRRLKLLAKFLGRYHNQKVAKCFLPWAAAAACTRSRREEIVRRSLARLAFGILHLAFDAWRELIPRLKEDGELRAAADRFESHALGMQVAHLRHELALTRKELSEVSRASAKRYELAVVRAELISRQQAASAAADYDEADGDAGYESGESSGFTFDHRKGGKWWGSGGATGLPALCTTPDSPSGEVTEGVSIMPLRSSAAPEMPQSAFVRTLQRHAPHSFPLPPPEPPAPEPTRHAARPSSARVRPPSPRARAAGLAVEQLFAQRVTEQVLEGLAGHAKRLGL